jgi:hypothetical protein
MLKPWRLLRVLKKMLVHLGIQQIKLSFELKRSQGLHLKPVGTLRHAYRVSVLSPSATATLVTAPN